ncbi:tripartite tricarboxylate transporter TctB family protein [Seohaeicola nanhaiensis]|uniref:Tripartite tricarboxylate transporter TctB family protein n=1 Tax=Seohaeicola nanhaiensis TaxID=1387282 RepID=A0ABV9KBK7_9RHOB
MKTEVARQSAKEAPGRNRTGAGQTAGVVRLLPALLPAVLAVLALVLQNFVFWRGKPAVTTGLGPDAWPDLILNALALFSAIWLGLELWVLGRAGRRSALRAPDDDEIYRFGKAVIGIILIVLYGILLPLTGFALTTAAFIAIWCVYGGVRKPLVVLPVSLIGTWVLLWVFMGISLMPLSRGRGIFDQFSIWLLKALGIY